MVVQPVVPTRTLCRRPTNYSENLSLVLLSTRFASYYCRSFSLISNDNIPSATTSTTTLKKEQPQRFFCNPSTYSSRGTYLYSICHTSNNNSITHPRTPSLPQPFDYQTIASTVAYSRTMSTTTTNDIATAISLLKDTPYFHSSSDSLIQALAAKMVLVTAVKGHVFVEEGQHMSQILILEEGKLVRTRLSMNPDEIRRTSIKELSRSLTLVDNSVTVDYLEGRGRVAGLLHTFKASDHSSFASVSVVTDTAKVWVLDAEDFRTIVSTAPQHCLDMLGALARELREGSKSLRGLMQQVKKTGSSVDTDGTASKNILKVMCYDTTSWVSEGFEPAIAVFNEQQKLEHPDDAVEIDMHYTTERLSEDSATYAAGYDAVCLFVNDAASEQIIRTLSLLNVKMIAMRCAGFDRVDTRAARAYGLTVARVPAYSPYAVAEMAVTLLMAVNRKIARANARIKMANFSLDSGLMGMDIFGKTVGVMGTGKIGQILCRIMLGFGAKVQCYDVFQSPDVIAMGCTYVTKDEIFGSSDVLFLMMPLLEPTYHTINETTIQQMKKGVLLINTSRGGLVDTKALLKGIRDGIISGVGMDVYEYEQAYFFQDWSAKTIQDEDLLALIGENNVVLTAHQAFFTKEAVTSIVDTTLHNLAEYHYGKRGELHPNNCLPPPKPK